MQPNIRQSVDLTGYPDLCVVLLGLRVRGWGGVRAALRIGPGLTGLTRDVPDGLLGHDQFLFGWNHLGIRQYWRDVDSLERFTRSEPHAAWWRDFMKRYNSAGFWHETYSRSGRMEAVYIDMPDPVGFARFAPPRDPVGAYKGMRGRLDASAA